jgi:hypothetical protein
MKLLILLFACSSAYTAELNFEPVYGFERSLQAEPKPARYRTEIFLGVRATYGGPVLAGEAEINQSNSDNEFNGIKVKSQTQNLLLGLRLVPIAGQYYSLYMRGGIRARQQTVTVTQNSNESTSTNPTQIDPYAGTGIVFNLAGILALNASATLVYNRNAESSEQYDTQYSLGASFRFGNR